MTAHEAYLADPRSSRLSYPEWVNLLGEAGVDAARRGLVEVVPEPPPEGGRGETEAPGPGLAGVPDRAT